MSGREGTAVAFVALSMLFCKTQPALVATFAAGIAAGITWYLNRAARRWCRLRLHARRGLAPPRRVTPVEKMTGGPTLQHHPQYQLDVLPATAVGPKRTRSVMSAALVSEPESPAIVHACNQAHLLELPDDLLVLILASLSPAEWHAFGTSAPSGKCNCRCCKAYWVCKLGVQYKSRRQLQLAHPNTLVPCCTAREGTVGKALALAGACCKAFARCVTEAATVAAGHHGWRLPLAGSCTPVRHLSKLELDTIRVRFCVRAMSHRSEPYAAFLDFWIADLVLALSAPCLNVDAQVRRQQTLELGALLFRAAMDVWRWCPGQCSLLHVLMSCPGTPLDASWLASRVIPYLKDPVLDVCTEDLVHRRKVVTYRQRVVERLSLKLPVLQDHPEIMEWLQQNTEVERPSLLEVHLSWVFAPARARRAARRYKPGGDMH